MEAKVIRVLKKGTKLTVLQEKPGWLRVGPDDGSEEWVGKAMASEGTHPKSP
jgi:SH3-like domain-containing protein